MAHIMVVDENKSSVVMTSEVFKEIVPGTTVTVCHNGHDCLEEMKNGAFDAVVVDFDLPDTDGISLAKILKKTVDKPIFITAFPDKTITEAIGTELFLHQDLSSWIKKPVNSKDMTTIVESYMRQKGRIARRFGVTIKDIVVSGDRAGKGKAQTKAKIISLSISGAQIQVATSVKYEVGANVSIKFPGGIQHCWAESNKKKESSTPSRNSSVAGKVVWLDQQAKQFGVHFSKLNEPTRASLAKIFEAVQPTTQDEDN